MAFLGGEETVWMWRGRIVAFGDTVNLEFYWYWRRLLPNWRLYMDSLWAINIHGFFMVRFFFLFYFSLKYGNLILMIVINTIFWAHTWYMDSLWAINIQGFFMVRCFFFLFYFSFKYGNLILMIVINTSLITRASRAMRLFLKIFPI